MKILQIIQKPQLRGAEIFACQLSDELIKIGHRVTIAYLFDNSSFDLDYDLNFIPINGRPNRRFWDFAAYSRINEIIMSGNYDIVQANAGDTLKYASLSRKIYGWKTPLIFRNANKMSGFIRSTLHKRINHFFLKEVDHIVSVSENCRQDIIELYPPSAEISSTATIGTYEVNDEISPVRRRGEGPIWINVGSFVPEKNHLFLLDIFSAYYQKYRKGHLYLVGDGKLREILEEKVRKLNLERIVTFWGYRKDAIALIKMADIMVMPSKIDGLPAVILEAMACGKPIISANVGGIPEVIVNGINGYCLREYNVDAYLEKIADIIEDKALYHQMSKNGKQQIRQQYLMSDISKRFASIYLYVGEN